MATTTDKDETKTRILWLLGGAAATAIVYFYVQKSLKDREQLQLINLEEKLAREKKLTEASE